MMETPSKAALEKQIRILTKSLARSEQHRAELEHLRDRDQALYQTMHAEISAAQATIQRKNEELEGRNAEILAQRDELERALLELRRVQSRLVQQEKLAALGQLTAGIAHEIKNPLNFVINFASLSVELLDDMERERQRVPTRPIADFDQDHATIRLNLSKVEEHGLRADGIVRSMLEHARSGDGKRETVDLNRLVEEHVKLAYQGARARMPGFDVTVDRDYDAGVGAVALVPQEIGRVVLNLLDNAFYAVAAPAVEPGRTPVVTVSTRRTTAGVTIQVTDNGPGIPEAIREKIFEPFFTTKPAGSGTGLGLSMSHDIVTQGHGGSLTVGSTEGEGATFLVTLPG